MSSAQTPPKPEHRLVLPLFVGSIFLSAFLLFLVQPMFTKMVLPKLGGTPAVWSIAMVFFQGLLLLGYGYAHLSSRYLATRAAVLVHAVLLGLTAFTLPLALPEDMGRPPADGEALWLVGVFGLAVGVPFFAASTTGPLLQAWFSRTGHAQARDPYFLYGASNLGSFGGLLLYPLLFEPLLLLRTQAVGWSLAFGVLSVSIVACGIVATRLAGPSDTPTVASPSAPVALSTRLAWIGLAFVPSGAMVAMTSYVSTDIGSAPFLWVVPLTLYLLTFVLVFRDPPSVRQELLVTLAPIVVPIVNITYFLLFSSAILAVGVHLLAFLLLALMCHSRLFALRPESARLTDFYLMVSVGGVLGGLFTGLFSPVWFDDIYEYPILLTLSVACLPVVVRRTAPQVLAEGTAILGAAGAWVWALPRAAALTHVSTDLLTNLSTLILPTGIWLFRKTPFRATAVAAAVFAMPFVMRDLSTSFEYKTRSFFGVNTLRRTDDGRCRQIVHGSTLHGAQCLFDAEGRPLEGRPEPTTYYTPIGGMGRTMAAVRADLGGRIPNVAVAGLGAGAIACTSVPGEAWTFFEIDPDVIDLATDGRWFTFLPGCTPDAKVEQGDARLSLEDSTARFDVLVVDCFSADAVPMHLLTVGAIRTYLSRLTEDGVLVMHVSNRFMNLEPVLSAAGAALGLSVTALSDPETTDDPDALRLLYRPSRVIVMTRTAHATEVVRGMVGTRPAVEVPADRAWTDDWSNLLGAILDRSG